MPGLLVGPETSDDSWKAWTASRVESLRDAHVLRSLRPIEPGGGDGDGDGDETMSRASSTEVFVSQTTFASWQGDNHDLGGSADAGIDPSRSAYGGIDTRSHGHETPSTSVSLYAQTDGNVLPLSSKPSSSPEKPPPKKLTLFSSNDYLGLGSHEYVRTASGKAAYLHGAGPRSSPLVCGYTKLHRDLEVGLASLKKTQECLLFPTGFAANTGTIPSLCDSPECEIFSDALNHASIVDGCKLAKGKCAKVTTYLHCDMFDLERVLQKSTAKRKLIITDSLFSVDGDWAPLKEIVALKQKYSGANSGLLLMVDEAHSTLVCGKRGGGACEMFGLDGNEIDIHVGTLSKAFGSHGGFVCCSRDMKSILVSTARSQIFSTSLPAPCVAAALAALEIGSGNRMSKQSPVSNEGGLLRAKLWRHVNRVHYELCTSNDSGNRVELIGGGVCEGVLSPIFVLTFGDERKALAASGELLAKGIHAPAIRPPTVPKGTELFPPTALRLRDCPYPD
jgi:8-amino-7-oxononanoate synthase